MPETKETFGNWLKRTRDKRGLSQLDVAALAETTSASMSRFESGDRPPSRNMAHRIGEALGDVDGALLAAGFVPTGGIQSEPGTKANPLVLLDPNRRALRPGDFVILETGTLFEIAPTSKNPEKFARMASDILRIELAYDDDEREPRRGDDK